MNNLFFFAIQEKLALGWASGREQILESRVSLGMHHHFSSVVYDLGFAEGERV